MLEKLAEIKDVQVSIIFEVKYRTRLQAQFRHITRGSLCKGQKI
jgi:hypothetical protein